MYKVSPYNLQHIIHIMRMCIMHIARFPCAQPCVIRVHSYQSLKWTYSIKQNLQLSMSLYIMYSYVYDNVVEYPHSTGTCFSGTRFIYPERRNSTYGILLNEENLLISQLAMISCTEFEICKSHGMITSTYICNIFMRKNIKHSD